MGSPKHRAPMQPQRHRAALLMVLVASSWLMAAMPAAGYSIVTGTPKVSTALADMSTSPWFTRAQGMDWVMLMYPGEAKGDNLGSYLCDVATKPAGSTCDNSAWQSQSLPTIVSSNPFNAGNYNPFSVAADKQFTGKNDCVNYASCISTQTYEAPSAGQQVFFALDIGYGQAGGTSLFEMFLEEDGGPPVALVKYYSRIVAPTVASDVTGYTAFPAAAGTMVNVLVNVQLDGGKRYRWGFRNKGVKGTSADNWVVTRILFGCVGPKRADINAYSLPWNSTSIAMTSEITTPLPDGSTIDPSMVNWDVSCNGPNTPTGGNAISLTGFSNTLTVGGKDAQIMVATQTFQCIVTITAKSTNQCPGQTDMTINVGAAPVLAPVVTGLPAGNTLKPSAQTTVTLTATSPTIISPATYGWTVTCGGATANPTSATANIVVGFNSSAFVNLYSPYGNAQCQVSVDITTDVQGAATSSTSTITLMAPPKVALNAKSKVTTNTPTNFVVDAGGSLCANPPCTSKVSVGCPGAAVVEKVPSSFNGSISFRVGAGEEIEAPTGSAIVCSVTLAIRDANGVSMQGQSDLTVAPPIVLPSGDITGLPLNGGSMAGPYPVQVNVSTSASGTIGAPTYSWTVECPAGSSPPDYNSSGPNPNWNFIVGKGQAVDPYNPYGNTACSVTATVSTPSQDSISKSSSVTFLAPPVPVLSGAPYFAGPNYPHTVSLDASTSKCANPPCTYEWAVSCPDGSAVTKDGQTASLTIGDGLDIDPSLFTSSTRCNVKLTVTDLGAIVQTGSASSTLSTQPQLGIPPGAISGLPPNGGNFGGPYPKLVNVSVNASGIIGAASYNWTLRCPPGAPGLLASFSGAAPDWFFWVGEGKEVDPFSPYGNKVCTVGIAVTTAAQGTDQQFTNVTFLAPPVAAFAGAPFAAKFPLPTRVRLDASRSKCANPPCFYQWAIECSADVAFNVTGGSVLAVGVGAGEDIDTSLVGTGFSCSVIVGITDSSSPEQSGTAKTTLTGSTLSIPPDGILGLPPNFGSIAGPYPKMINVSVNATGIVGQATYNWTLRCPPGAASSISLGSTNGASPDWPFWVGQDKDIDVFNPYGNKFCAIGVTVSTPTQGEVQQSTNVTFLAPAVGALVDAPYQAGPKFPALANLTAITKCANEPCTWRWIVVCPNGDRVNKTGDPDTTIGLGPGQDIDTSALTQDMICNVTLLMNDSSSESTSGARLATPGRATARKLSGASLLGPLQVSQVSSTLTVSYSGEKPPAPGSINGLPPSGGSIGGPYPVMVNVSINGSNDNSTVYSWTLSCPPGAPAVASASGFNPDWSFWVGDGKVVDPFNPYGNKICNLSITAEANGLNTTKFSVVTFKAPPVAALTGAPYAAGPTYPSTIQLDANASLCANPNCLYQWYISCPGRDPAVLQGPKPAATFGFGSTYTFNVLSLTDKLSCTVLVRVTDSGSPQQQSEVSTALEVIPPGQFINAGGPYNIMAGETATLDATRSVCSKIPCSFNWEVTCPSGVFKKTGAIANITTGAASANASVALDINTWGLTSSLNCTVKLSGSDASGTDLGPADTTYLTVNVAPPVCSGGRLSIGTVIGPVTKPRACVIKQALRRNKKNVKGTHSAITLTGVKDPQGFDVVANITAIVTNQGLSSCPCDPKCTCQPDAEIRQGGQTAFLIPLLTPRRDAVLAKTGRSYLFRFTGISKATGLTCTGTTQLCVAKKNRNKVRKCVPFDGTFTLRDATKCLSFTSNAATLDEAYQQLGL